MSRGPLESSPADPLPPLDPAGERPTRVRWLIFALACGTSWLLYFHRYTWNHIGPYLERDYHYSNTQVQTLGSMFNWTYASCAVPSGILCDFIGPHLFLSILIVLWSIVMPGQILAGNPKLLGGVRLLFGAAQSGAYPALGKSTQIWFRPASRTVLQGWIATAFGRGGGAMTSIVMGTILIGKFGLSWQTALWVMAVPGLLFGIAFFALFRNSPETDARVNDAERAIINEGRPPSSTNASSVLPWRLALRNRSILMGLVQQFHGAGADSFFSLTLGSYFLRGWKVSDTESGFLVGLPLIGGAVGGMLGAFLNDLLYRLLGNRRWSRSLVGMTGSGVAACLMVGTIFSPTPMTAAVMLFFVKFFADWSQPTVWGTVTDIGGRFSSTVFGLVNTAGTLGSAVIPPMIGRILDRTLEWLAATNPEAASGSHFGYALALIAVLYVVSSISWIFIDCTRTVESQLSPPRAEA